MTKEKNIRNIKEKKNLATILKKENIAQNKEQKLYEKNYGGCWFFLIISIVYYIFQFLYISVFFSAATILTLSGDS